MRTSYEELKKVFSNRNFIKGSIKKILKIIGIFAISLLLLSLIYIGEWGDFSIKFWGILFIIISIAIAIAIICEDRCMTIFKYNIANVNNYLINRYNFNVENDLMIKKVGKAIYSFEYDVGIISNKNLTKKEGLYSSRKFGICMICKIYNIGWMEYNELGNLMKEGINEIVMNPEEKSVKILGEFSNAYRPEEILFFMSQKLEYFETNLKKALEKEKSISDIEFEKKMLNILGKEKSEEYISTQTFAEQSETSDNYNQIDFSKSEFNYESMYGKNLIFKNYNKNSYFKKIFQNVLIVNASIALIYFTFYIANGYNLQSKFTAVLVMLTCILITIPALLEEILLPSYVLTKKIGLKEKRREKFYGTLSNGISFCVSPYKSKRFFKDEFPSPFRIDRMIHYGRTNLKLSVEVERIGNYLSTEKLLSITQDGNVEQVGDNIIIYEEVQNANVKKQEMLEDTMDIMLKKLANIFGIYSENIILENEHKYNVKSMCFNLINRCFDKVTFLFNFIPSIYTLYFYGIMLYTFVIDVMKHF